MYSQIYALDVVPGRRDDFRALGVQHAAECLQEESGTLRCDSFQDESNAYRVYAVETDADLEAFEAHRNGAVLQRNYPLFAPMLAVPPILLGRGFNKAPSADSLA